MCINLYCMPAVHYMVFQSKEWKAGFIIHCASFSGQGTVEKHTFEKKKVNIRIIGRMYFIRIEIQPVMKG